MGDFGSIAPDRDSAIAALGQGQAQLVWTRIVADTETPVSAMLKLGEAQSGSFLLESVEGGQVRGRYSLLGLDPDLVWRASGDSSEINRDWRRDRSAFVPMPGGQGWVLIHTSAIEPGKIDAVPGLLEAGRRDIAAQVPEEFAAAFALASERALGTTRNAKTITAISRRLSGLDSGTP